MSKGVANKHALHWVEALDAVAQSFNCDYRAAVQGGHWRQAGIDALDAHLSCMNNPMLVTIRCLSRPAKFKAEGNTCSTSAATSAALLLNSSPSSELHRYT